MTERELADLAAAAPHLVEEAKRLNRGVERDAKQRGWAIKVILVGTALNLLCVVAVGVMLGLILGGRSQGATILRSVQRTQICSHIPPGASCYDALVADIAKATATEVLRNR